MNNIEEYQVALAFGEDKFTSPWHEDTDEDGMPDGWEATNGLDPRDGSNGDIDSDRDGYDADGDGSVTFDQLENVASLLLLMLSWMIGSVQIKPLLEQELPFLVETNKLFLCRTG